MRTLQISGKIKRMIAIFLAFTSIICLILLSSGINKFSFLPGQPLNFQFKESLAFPSGARWDIPLIGSILLTMALATIPLGLILLIFSSEARKVFRRYMGPMLFLIAMYGIYLYLWREDPVVIDSSENLKPPSVSAEVISSGDEDDTEEFYTSPELPSFQGYAIGAITILVLGIAGYLIWSRNNPQESELSEIALKAIKDIQAGRHWEDAVIQCYIQMSSAVKLRRKLRRDISTTPAEYAVRLKEAGLPPGPIDSLTSLFEEARYSDRKSKTREAEEATQCLSDILSFLEEGA